VSFKADKIWFDGKLINWDDAKIHVLSHVIHYGSGAFEGLRLYKIKDKSAVFRLKDHTKRLFETCKIYNMEIPYSEDEINQAIMDTIKANNLKQAYIRPLVFRGMGALGLNPYKCPVQVIIAAWDWGKYLGEEALENGISACVSSWKRIAPNTFPFLAKASGNYLNSQLIKMEAIRNNYDEGIALDIYGYIAEGSGENVFIIRNQRIITPPSSASILPGITRHTVFKIAAKLGYKVEAHRLPRESLYIADEVFLTGTAAEITPVTRIDNIPIKSGKRGPITKEIQDCFFGILSGEIADDHNWLTYI